MTPALPGTLPKPFGIRAKRRLKRRSTSATCHVGKPRDSILGQHTYPRWSQEMGGNGWLKTHLVIQAVTFSSSMLGDLPYDAYKILKRIIDTQVIQAVTCSSPNAGLVTFTASPLISDHVFTHHPKKSTEKHRELPGSWVFFSVHDHGSHLVTVHFFSPKFQLGTSQSSEASSSWWLDFCCSVKSRWCI